MTSRELVALRLRLLDAKCAGKRPTVRRYVPLGYDVTIYRGPYDDLVELVVEADWHPGCCVSWDCPGEDAGWDIGQAWVKRRGTWRTVTLNKREVRQIEQELNN